MSAIVLNGPGHPAIPDIEFTLEIVESSYEPNTEGTGMILKCKAQVVQEVWPSPQMYINYRLEDADPRIQERGQRDFAALRRAVGVLNPQDTEELHWRAFKVRVGSRPNRRGKLENHIVEYIFGRAA